MQVVTGSHVSIAHMRIHAETFGDGIMGEMPEYRMASLEKAKLSCMCGELCAETPASVVKRHSNPAQLFSVSPLGTAAGIFDEMMFAVKRT